MIRASAEKCRVLIVDDDRQIRELLTELIEDEGYEVMAAADGASGLEAVN